LAAWSPTGIVRVAMDRRSDRFSRSRSGGCPRLLSRCAGSVFRRGVTLSSTSAGTRERLTLGVSRDWFRRWPSSLDSRKGGAAQLRLGYLAEPHLLGGTYIGQRLWGLEAGPDDDLAAAPTWQGRSSISRARTKPKIMEIGSPKAHLRRIRMPHPRRPASAC